MMLAPRHQTTNAVAWAESANGPDMHLASTSPAPPVRKGVTASITVVLNP